MLKQIEGSRAIAEVVALCRPEVICAYPITPQTHIVEGLSEIVKSGALERCAFVNVESEFAAMSVAIGASAAGARAYTATSSQGLLYMTEAVYNASGLGLPIVMTLGTRAIGAPINIWNDHSDAMALRDAGWIQLFASSNQEAVDQHLVAFRLAEELSVPVMVCVDGFILTHAFERVDVPTQAEVDAWLPPFSPRQVLDADAPLTIGALVGPEAFTEVKALQREAHGRAIARVPELAAEMRARLGRDAGGLVRPYRTQGADVVIVALGSVNGTIEELVDAMRGEGIAIGSLDVRTYRPFPRDAVAEALRVASRVIVVEKNLVIGSAGALASDVRDAIGHDRAAVHTVVAGLGGRAITQRALRGAVDAALAGTLPEPALLGADARVLDREVGRRIGEAPWRAPRD